MRKEIKALRGMRAQLEIVRQLSQTVVQDLHASLQTHSLAKGA